MRENEKLIQSRSYNGIYVSRCVEILINSDKIGGRLSYKWGNTGWKWKGFIYYILNMLSKERAAYVCVCVTV